MWSFVPDLTVSHSPSADWWQESEAHARGAAAFFPPLLNLHPAFASNLKSYDPSHLQSSGKKIKKKNQLAPAECYAEYSGCLKRTCATALKSEFQPDSLDNMSCTSSSWIGSCLKTMSLFCRRKWNHDW